jgi:UDP-N-acetylmuramate dehydrogenase
MDIQQNVPIAPFTTYKIGGNADYYCEAHTADDIPKLIKYALSNKMPYFILGGGSNTIFSDNGFRGLIIHNKAISIKVEGDKVIAESGAMLSKVINEAKKHNLGGITKLTGLPGTIGGAVYGNAGAHGVEIGNFVEKVKLFTAIKDVFEEGKDYFKFSYRYSILKENDEIILEVTLKLPPLQPDEGGDEELISRIKKQPKGMSAGSFFQNPSIEKPAGYLIDQAGLKGEKVGDIEISDLHANWLINTGKGTQKDLIKLAKKIKKTVRKRFDIELKPENILVDEYGNRIDI